MVWTVFIRFIEGIIDTTLRDLREVRLQCQRLSNENEDLKAAAEESRAKSRAARQRADAASKEREEEKRITVELMKRRDVLEAAAAADKKSLARLRLQLTNGAPSARLLERARSLKRTAEDLRLKLDSKTEELSARTAELESTRREARVLSATLDLKIRRSSAGIDDPKMVSRGLLELGNAKVTQHELTLELAHVSGRLEAMLSEKQEVENKLSLEETKAKHQQADIALLTDDLRSARVAAEKHREDAGTAHASAREALQEIEALRAREKTLLGTLETAERRCAEVNAEVEMLSEQVKRGDALGARVEELKGDLEACRSELQMQRRRAETALAAQQAAARNSERDRQRLEVLEKADEDRQRLEDALRDERRRNMVIQEEARAELKRAQSGQEELLRGLQQAKLYNDDLAKERDKAVSREKEAVARFVDVTDGKLALQRALLEQLAANKLELCAERERREEVEAALTRLSTAPAEPPPPPQVSANTQSAEAHHTAGSSDDEDLSLSLEDARSPPFRRRATLVQDYLGREGAEQFLSDWDEERSSRSSSLVSMLSLPSGGGGEGGGTAERASPPKYSSSSPPQRQLPLQDGDTMPGHGGRRRRSHPDVRENLCSKLRFEGARVERDGGGMGAGKFTTATAAPGNVNVANRDDGRLNRAVAGCSCGDIKQQRGDRQRRGENLDSQRKDDLAGQSSRTHAADICSSSRSSSGSRHLARATDNDAVAAEPTTVSNSNNSSCGVNYGRNAIEGRRVRSWSTREEVIDSGPIEIEGSSAVDLPSASSDDACMSVQTRETARLLPKTHAPSSRLGDGRAEKGERPPPSLLDLAHRGIDDF